MTTIHLGGKLGKLFGKKWELLVSSPAEAVHAIDVNTGGAFKRYLAKDGQKKFYKVAVGKKDSLLDRTELANRSGQNDIFIMPTIRGANSGWGKIIAGIILIVAAIALTVFTGTPIFITASLAAFGAGLVFGGIEQLMTPVPKQVAQLQSYNFQGNAATANQGGPVPLIYGTCLVTPIPICINFDSVDTQATSNTTLGKVDTIPLPGGGYQYSAGGTTSNTNATP